MLQTVLKYFRNSQKLLIVITEVLNIVKPIKMSSKYHQNCYLIVRRNNYKSYVQNRINFLGHS